MTCMWPVRVSKARKQGLIGVLVVFLSQAVSAVTLSAVTLSAAPQSMTLPIHHWGSTQQPAYLQLPTYQQGHHVSLQLSLPDLPPTSASGPQTAQVVLNGKVIRTVTLKPSMTLPLPDLPPGISELYLRALDHTGGQGQPQGSPPTCAPLGANLSIQEPLLRFTPEMVAAPALAQLPDGLYQSGQTELSIGAFETDHWDGATTAAALGLAQVLSGGRRVVWQSQDDPGLPADFHVALRQRPRLSTPARLELQPGRLNVYYRQPADLSTVVNTLASPDLRGQLLGPTANLSTTVLLPQPALRLPQTLEDMGIGRYQVLNNQRVAQALTLPPVWVAQGPTRGILHYLLPSTTAQPQLSLSVGNRRNNVAPGQAMQVRGKEVSVQYRGSTLPASGGLDFVLQASGLRAGLMSAGPGEGGDLNECQAALTVLPDTRVDVQARFRSGLAHLPRLLIYDPSVQLPLTPEAISLALNIAGSLQAWGLSDTLPWQVTFTGKLPETPTRPTLLLVSGLPAQSSAHVANLPELSLVQSPLLKAQVQLRYASGTQATNLARYWWRIPAQLDDQLTRIQITPGGTAQVLEASRSSSTPEQARWALVFSFVALPLLACWQWWQQRRRDSPRHPSPEAPELRRRS